MGTTDAPTRDEFVRALTYLSDCAKVISLVGFRDLAETAEDRRLVDGHLLGAIGRCRNVQTLKEVREQEGLPESVTRGIDTRIRQLWKEKKQLRRNKRKLLRGADEVLELVRHMPKVMGALPESLLPKMRPNLALDFAAARAEGVMHLASSMRTARDFLTAGKRDAVLGEDRRFPLKPLPGKEARGNPGRRMRR